MSATPERLDRVDPSCQPALRARRQISSAVEEAVGLQPGFHVPKRVLVQWWSMFEGARCVQVAGWALACAQTTRNPP